MTPAPEPGGASVRRGNGLVPARWAVAATLDPAAGNRVLAALARAGVAAAVESPGVDEPGRRALVWVDAQREAQARRLLAAEFPSAAALLPQPPAGDLAPPDGPGDGGLAGTAGPTGAGPTGGGPTGGGPTGGGAVVGEPAGGGAPAAGGGSAGGPGRPGRREVDEDAAWAQIVAGWDRDAATPVPPWPVTEDVAPERPAGSGGALPSPPTPAGTDGPATSPPGPPSMGPRDHVAAEGRAEEHYVPPPPPPLPGLRRGTVAALVVLALGIVLLFAPQLVGLYESDAIAVSGIACIVGSVVALVHGMRDTPGGGSDDGAVV